MDHQTEQIEKWKKEYFRREKWRKLQAISISFCFICIMLCVAGILYCTNQQKVQSTITVDYSRPYYTVSFDPAGGSACASKSVRLGDTYGTLPTPTRKGFVFRGWTASVFTPGTERDWSAVLGSMQKFSIDGNKITLASQGSGTPGLINNTKHAYNLGDVYTVDPGSSSKRILLRILDSNGSLLDGTSITVSGWTWNMYYKCYYQEKTTGATFQIMDGNVKFFQIGIAANTGSSTVQTWNDIGVYKGTYMSENYFTTSTTQMIFPYNHTLTAAWAIGTYNITYNLNGGTLGGSTNSKTTTIKTFEETAIETPKRDGYDFTGWTLSGDGFFTGTGQSVFGKPQLSKPSFAGGENQLSVYNNAGNGNVVFAIKNDLTVPNNTGYYLEITTKGSASPGHGGFTFYTASYASGILTTVIVAKIPLGFDIDWHSNQVGDGRSLEWLTGYHGTGEWRTYICRLRCGASGTFNSTNYFALSGGWTVSESDPVVWQVAYAQVFDSTYGNNFKTVTNSSFDGGAMASPLGVYNNTGNGNVQHSIVADSSGGGNKTGYVLKIQNTGEAAPALGGYYHGTMSYRNAVFMCHIVAKIPVGYRLCWTRNAYGDDGNWDYLTDTSGTGDWKTYVVRVRCGGSGTFSSVNFLYIYGGDVGTPSNPVTWYVAYSQVFDVTNQDDSYWYPPQLYTCQGDNATLTAYWTPKTIKITLNKNGGSGGTDTFYYKYGTNTFYSDAACSTQITTISMPSRTGYTFVHYYGDGSCGGSNGENYVKAYDSSRHFATDLCYDIYKDATLYANWKANTYTLTLDMQSGSGGTSSTTATYNATVPSITPPSRNGYDFAGYYSSTGGGGTKYYNASGAGVATWTTDASTTLYAYWTPKTIKITLNKNGGSGGTDTFYYKYGTNTFYSDAACSTQITTISMPSRTGYTFVHYYGDGSCGGSNGENYVKAYDSSRHFATDLCYDIYKDATLYANWKANTYTLTIAYTVPRCGTCNAAGTVSHWVNCSTCGGAGTVAGQVTCSSCNGSGGYYDDCWKCDGSGTVSSSCSKCNGAGSLTCPYCNGSGKHSLCGGTGWGGGCSDCGGTGICPYCEGGTYNCGVCNGTGSISSTCSRCDGDGYTSSDWNNCSNCSGSGTVTGQVTCSSCKGNKGSNVSGTCTTCSGSKTNFSGGTQTVTVTYGQTLPSFTVKSFTGYTIGVPNYSVSGTSATSSSTYTTAGNTTWNATFTPVKYTMTLSASGGSWSGYASGTTSVPFGTSVSLTFTNSTSYDNKTSKISGYVSASGSSSASVSFVMPAQNISISGSGSGSNNACLAYDTPILTSNGWKMVQDITYTDLLVRFNHDTGQIDLAYPSWISKPVAASKIVQVTFSDGEVIRFAGDHAVFSLDQNKYVTVTDPSKFAVGTRVLKYVAGDCGENACSSCSCCTGGNCSTWGEAVVTDIKVLEEDVLAYSIITPGTWNCFAGNILTTVPNTIIFQNMYGFKKDLTYASSIRQKVLNGQYDDHLFTEQELADMGWSSRDIVGFRGREWKILVESGMIDMDFVLNVLQKEVVNNSNERLLPNVNSRGNFEFVVTTSLDLACSTFNPKNYIYEEYFEYVLPNISDENFVGWHSSSDGKIYRAGESYIVRTGTHFQAVFLQ